MKRRSRERRPENIEHARLRRQNTDMLIALECLLIGLSGPSEMLYEHIASAHDMEIMHRRPSRKPRLEIIE